MTLKTQDGVNTGCQRADFSPCFQIEKPVNRQKDVEVLFDVRRVEVGVRD